jgi:hypothetical protein
MTSKCPYCGGPLTGEATIPPMNKRRRRLYNAAAKAGGQGITLEKLLPRMYPKSQKPTPSAWGVLRVEIHELNKDLRKIKQRVAAKNGSYFLFSTET